MATFDHESVVSAHFWKKATLRWAIVSQQLQDPAGQSLGPSGVFWSSRFPPCSGRMVTTTGRVLGHNLWSGLWYGTVSGGGIHIASSLPDNQETSVMKQSGQMGEGQLYHKDLILHFN